MDRANPGDAARGNCHPEGAAAPAGCCTPAGDRKNSSAIDWAPVTKLAGSALTLGAGLFGGAPASRAILPEFGEDDPLEDLWREGNKELCDHLDKLTNRSRELLERLASSGETEANTVVAGQALVAVQSQIAVIVEARRAWIASHEMSTTTTASLGIEDLFPFEGQAFPERATEFQTPSAQEDLVDSGFLVARLEPSPPKSRMTAT